MNPVDQAGEFTLAIGVKGRAILRPLDGEKAGLQSGDGPSRTAIDWIEHDFAAGIDANDESTIGRGGAAARPFRSERSGIGAAHVEQETAIFLSVGVAVEDNFLSRGQKASPTVTHLFQACFIEGERRSEE